MSLSHHIRRHPAATTILRRFCTTTTTASPPPSIQSENEPDTIPHEFLPPSEFINSWKPTKDPKEAQYRLILLRRDYAKQVKQVRKTYIHEMETKRLEELKKKAAKKEAQRIESEARREAKVAKKKLEAKERELAQQDFRETLLKERAEKLEYWRAREQKVQEKKKAARELIRRKSSMWIDETDLEKNLLENVSETLNI